MALSTNPDKKIETELADILSVIEECKLLNSEEIKIKFWDMFIVDAIIGNTDRHNGNWGFLLNNTTKEITFSPIYDCGSCLNPILEDSDIEKLNDTELKNLAINCYSCIKENGKKINYITYIKSCKNKDVNEAICRNFKKINIEKIMNFIDNVSCLSEIRKNFYKNIVKIRYEILKETYEKIIK